MRSERKGQRSAGNRQDFIAGNIQATDGISALTNGNRLNAGHIDRYIVNGSGQPGIPVPVADGPRPVNGCGMGGGTQARGQSP